jgi:integrase
MKMQGSFDIYRRKKRTGHVYYYRIIDENGKRTCGHSTNQSSRTAAREYCIGLIRDDKLIPTNRRGKKAVPLFKDFARGFWDYETSEYLKSRKGRRLISKGYATQGEFAVRNHLIPAFGEKRLDLIKHIEVDTWLSTFKEKTYTDNDKKERHYKSSSANLAFKILKIMLNYAVKKELIKQNPCKNIEMLITSDEREVQILTPEEEKALFPKDWETIWDDRLYYVLNRLAACTGMRHGEILGLRGEFVFETYIDVRAQYNRYGYGDTKSHKSRNIPIHETLRKDLELLIKDNGEGFIFSDNGGEKPVSRKYVYEALYKALDRIGINEDERKRRCLSMHGWRHFLNTELVMADVPDKKVQAVTGHVTDKEEKRYTHINNTRIEEVIKVQEKLLETKESEAIAEKQESVASKLRKQKEKEANAQAAVPVVKRGRGRPKKTV